jgi:S-(hydroxymethyl)glutathione dehydrogenase/alcohol dehydrogenase
MKAAVLWKVREPMVVEDVELEDPKEGEVLVRLAASGVCHSCLHAADGTWDWGIVPSVLGDEGAGVVKKVGSNVSHLKSGDHVILSWSPTCFRAIASPGGRSSASGDPVRPLYDGSSRAVRGRRSCTSARPPTPPRWSYRRTAWSRSGDIPPRRR